MNTQDHFPVLLVSNSKLFLEGVRKILESQKDIKIEAKIAIPGEFEEHLDEIKSGFVIFDNRGLDLNISRLSNLMSARSPGAKVILFLDRTEERPQFQNLIYINNETNSARLIEIIKGNNKTFPTKEAFVRASTKKQVTNTETRVIELIEKGLTNREIAGELLIREKTVKAHITSIFSKLGFQRRYQLMIHGTEIRRRVKYKI